MGERKAIQFIFEDKTRPMNQEDFADIELSIRSLRNLRAEDKYEFIVVAFKNKIEKLDFIQAYSVESYKICYLEIGFIREGKQFPQIFALNDVPVNEAVEIFRSVCCSMENPSLTRWKDRTDEILKNEEIEDK